MLKTPLFAEHFFPSHQGRGEIVLLTTTCMLSQHLLLHIVFNTFNLKSVLLLYGSLNGFLEYFPAEKLVTLTQSKNLSNISANLEVSSALTPTTSFTALATELLL